MVIKTVYVAKQIVLSVFWYTTLLPEVLENDKVVLTFVSLDSVRLLIKAPK